MFFPSLHLVQYRGAAGRSQERVLSDAESQRLKRRLSSAFNGVAEHRGAIPNHSLADAGLVRQVLEEHGVRFFPRFDIIEIIKNDRLNRFRCKGVSNED